MNEKNAWSQMSDSEIAAQFSIQATQAGRLELAEALIRVAMQAYRAERRPETVDVPFAGHTRHEYPRLRTAAPVEGPTGNGDADLQREQAQLAPAATAVIQMPTGEQISANEGSRCAAKVLKGNVYTECHGAVLWMPAAGGGPAGGPFVEAHWAHVDRMLEQDHQAQV